VPWIAFWLLIWLTRERAVSDAEIFPVIPFIVFFPVLVLGVGAALLWALSGFKGTWFQSSLESERQQPPQRPPPQFL
jgi:hypothetical protein